MDYAEALKHLQTLINVASKADDPCVAHRILREMIGVINNVEPPKPRPDPCLQEAVPPSQRSNRPAAWRTRRVEIPLCFADNLSGKKAGEIGTDLGFTTFGPMMHRAYLTITLAGLLTLVATLAVALGRFLSRSACATGISINAKPLLPRVAASVH
jgi:hypothetical protein